MKDGKTRSKASDSRSAGFPADSKTTRDGDDKAETISRRALESLENSILTRLWESWGNDDCNTDVILTPGIRSSAIRVSSGTETRFRLADRFVGLTSKVCDHPHPLARLSDSSQCLSGASTCFSST